MSEFGGLRKHEKTQHTLVGLGSAAFETAESLTQVRRPEFPERDTKVYNLFLIQYEDEDVVLYNAVVPCLVRYRVPFGEIRLD